MPDTNTLTLTVRFLYVEWDASIQVSVIDEASHEICYMVRLEQLQQVPKVK